GGGGGGGGVGVGGGGRGAAGQVGARAERRPGVGQHDDPDRLVGQRGVQALAEPAHQGGGQCVAVVLLVHGQRRHRAAHHVVDRLIVTHGTPLSPATHPVISGIVIMTSVRLR